MNGSCWWYENALAVLRKEQTMPKHGLFIFFSKQQIWVLYLKQQSEERGLLYGNAQTQHYAREIQTRKVESLTNEQQKRTRSVIHSRWYFWRINIHYENWGTKIWIPRISINAHREIDWCGFGKSYRKYSIHQRVLSRRNTQCSNLTKRPREPTCAAECNSRAMKTHSLLILSNDCSWGACKHQQFSPHQEGLHVMSVTLDDNHKQNISKTKKNEGKNNTILRALFWLEAVRFSIIRFWFLSDMVTV